MSGAILTMAIGAGLGGLLGRFGRCGSGSCLLIANWKRGAIFGALLGLVFHLGSGGALSSYQAPKNVKQIPGAEFDSEVLKAGRPVVVDFYAPWCGPCKILSPRLDELAGEFGDRIKFVSVNVDEAQALVAQLNVRGIPTLLFIGKDGGILETSVGLLSQEELRAKLDKLAKG